jgi:hypothetical protein
MNVRASLYFCSVMFFEFCYRRIKSIEINNIINRKEFI